MTGWKLTMIVPLRGEEKPLKTADRKIGNLAEKTVSILFVGDGFPVPLHSSLFTASPNPFGRFSRLLREAKRLPYALTNSNLTFSLLKPIICIPICARKNDTERRRAKTTTVILRTTWPPALRVNSNLSVCCAEPITKRDDCPRHCKSFVNSVPGG